MATNYNSSMPGAGATRQAQVSAADWAGGMNPGGCAPGVGINTGDSGPKPGDWADSDWNGTNADPYVGASQYIGGIDPAESTDADTGNGAAGQTNQQVLSDPGVAANDGFTFVTADGDIADGAELVAASNVINRTGKTVLTGETVWGSLETP